MSALLNMAEKVAREQVNDIRHRIEHCIYLFALKIAGGVFSTGPIDPELAVRMEFIMKTRLDIDNRSDDALEKESKHVSKVFKSRSGRGILLALTLIIMTWGLVGFYMGYNWFIAVIPFVCLIVRMGPRTQPQRRPITKVLMGKPEGLYSIKQGSKHRGIGYLKDGTLYTRRHITDGMPLQDGKQTIMPSFLNRRTDNISYGFLPGYGDLVDGEEVIVLMTGIDKSSSSIVSKPYRTRAHVSAYGIASFQVYHKNLIGHGGSPVLKKIEKKKYCIVGSLGLCFPDTECQLMGDPMLQAGFIRSGVELMIVELGVKWVMQIFEHFTEQKYQMYMPGLVQLEDYSHVLVTSPTNYMCQNIYDILSTRFPGGVQLMTSSSLMPKKEGGIVVGPHDIMLEAILMNKWFMDQQTLWIVDWADHVSTKTLCLKDLVRHMARRDPCVYTIERSTTGYSLRSLSFFFSEESEFPIKEVKKSPKDMIESMMNDAIRRKVVVFVPNLKNEDQASGKRLEAMAKAKRVNCVLIHKENWTMARYNEAKNLKNGLIIATDIVDCRIDYEVDIVYDFQKTEQMLKHGDLVALHPTRIERGQRFKRRALVGQVKPGIYVSPQYDLLNMNKERIEYHDRAVFTASAALNVLEPLADPYTRLELHQALYWMSSHEFHSPRVIDMIFCGDGIRTNSDIHRQITKWLSSDKVSVTKNGRHISCGFWDERDDKLLVKLAAIDEQTIASLVNHYRRRIR